MRNQIVVICIFFMATALFAEQQKQKILFMTSTINHPEFIKMQHDTFKKFIQDDYEFVVFNDARDEKNSREIVAMCQSLNIPCMPVPQENRPIGKKFAWASYRHGQAMQYMMETVGFKHEGIVVLIDSDLFPIKKFSVVDYLEGYDIAGVRRGPFEDATEYLWPGLMFLRMGALPNRETMQFFAVETETVSLDSGGALYHYFQANPTVKKLFFKQRARLVFNKDIMPVYFYSCPTQWEFLKCSSCRTEKDIPYGSIKMARLMSGSKKCTHYKALFRELGFRDGIIDLIALKKVPHNSEFLLGDTFFHAGGGSGYVSRDLQKLKNKDTLTMDFMNLMLSST